jgi:serine/threonine protein kinase
MTGHEPLPPGYSGVELVLREQKRSLYRARDDVTSRSVTLHVVDVAELAPDGRRELAHEMVMLQRLRIHPNLLTVHRVAASPDGGSMTVVTDQFAGTTAGLVRRKGSLDVRWTTSIGIKVGGALATCHRAGLLHGRVQPDSIALTRSNEPCLVDLFMTRVLPAVGDGSAAAPGLATHCAPEILEGGPPSAAADVYGLASSLYELVTGRPPNPTGGDDPPTSMPGTMRHPPPPLLGPGIPPGLSELLLAAMAPDPEARPPSAQSLAHELQSIEHAFGWPITPILVFDAPEASTTITSRPEGRSSDSGHGGMTLSSDATFDPAAADRADASAATETTAAAAGVAHRHEANATATATAESRPGADPVPLECANGHRVGRADRPQRYCRYCGNPLFVRCVNGHAVAPSARFCRLCGQSLS